MPWYTVDMNKLKRSRSSKLGQFMKNLKKYHHLFKWKINSKGAIRAELNGRNYCPLTAVNFIVNAQKVQIGKAMIAANTMGLDSDKGFEIMEAADTKTSHPKMRHKLLEAVGLDSPTE